jgi:uncharacterized membrane protein YphA (DoxX/SURF4 family)
MHFLVCFSIRCWEALRRRVRPVRLALRAGCWTFASVADSPNRAWALLFARLVLGLIFFMAGTWKIFQLGLLEHARKYFLPFADTFLPIWSLWLVGVVVPLIEFAAGALVILGLRTRDALIALGFVLVIVTFGHLLHDPLYNLTGHVIPRVALLLFVLCFPREDDRFSLDYLLMQKRTDNL